MATRSRMTNLLQEGTEINSSDIHKEPSGRRPSDDHSTTTAVVGATDTALYKHNNSLSQNVIDGVKKFVIFIGYPRSGHSIVGSFMDAHPHMVITQLFARGSLSEQLVRWCSLLLLITSCMKVSHAQTNTVQLEHGNNTIINNTVFMITEVGDIDSGGTALICTTQLTPCCAARDFRRGHWYYPNGTEVPIMETGNSFYRIRRDAVGGVLGGVYLNRRFGATSPSGVYQCVIPGADGVDQTLYVGLYDIENNSVQLEHGSRVLGNNSIVMITEVGDIDSGGTALICTTQLTPCCAARDFRRGHWYYPNGTEVPIMETGYSFYRIRRDAVGGVLGGAYLNRRFGVASPSGVYQCVIPGADGVDQTLFVGLYDIENSISDGGATPTAGQSYSLTCTVSRADDLDTSYQWSRNGVDINGETSATLSFPSLSLSYAGSYICEVTVSSTLLDGGTTAVASSPLNISLPIAAPTAVLVTPPPTIFTGSSPTLTCTVEFNVVVVDVQLTVNVSWVLPGGSVSSGEPVTALNSSTYTSRLTLDAVTNTDAGTYTCQVVVSSQSLFITGTQSAEGSTNVSISPLPPGTPPPLPTGTTPASSAPSSLDNAVTVIISGVVAVLIVLIIAVASTVIITLILKHRRAELKLKEKSSRVYYDQPRGVVLSDVTRHNTAQEVGGDSGDHEYELIDKYSKPRPYEIPEATPPAKQAQQKPSSTGAYEFTQCPAYAPVTHGNQPAVPSDADGAYVKILP